MAFDMQPPPPSSAVRSHALFLDVVNIEPYPHHLTRGPVGRDVILEENPELHRHLANGFVAHAVVPRDDLRAGLLQGLFGYPFGNGGVVRSGGDELAEGLVFDSREIEPNQIKRAAGVIFPGASSLAAGSWQEPVVDLKHERGEAGGHVEVFRAVLYAALRP